MNLVGPKSAATHDCKRYSLVSRENLSHYSWMYLLTSKQDTPRALRRFSADTWTEGSVKVMRSDNGSEFREELGAILDHDKIKQEYIPPGVRCLNGVVERAIAPLSTTQ